MSQSAKSLLVLDRRQFAITSDRRKQNGEKRLGNCPFGL